MNVQNVLLVLSMEDGKEDVYAPGGHIVRIC